MAQLIALLADRLHPGHGPVAARLFAWPGDVSAAGASLPLRLAGGLHALRLRGDEALGAVYPPASVDDDTLWQAVSGALDAHAAFLGAWIERPPQTNEVRRAATFRACGHWLTQRFGLPLEVCELGASAGLNLNWDRFALDVDGARFGPADAEVVLAPDWTGPPPPLAPPRIAARRGVDLTPLSPEADRLRLLAYL